MLVDLVAAKVARLVVGAVTALDRALVRLVHGFGWPAVAQATAATAADFSTATRRCGGRHLQEKAAACQTLDHGTAEACVTLVS